MPNPAEREVTLVDWADGRITRRLPLPEGIQVGEDRTSIQCCDESLLATTKDGEIYLIDPITESRWRKVGACDGGIATIKPVILENQLIFQDSMQRLCSYDLIGGTLKWSLPLFLGRRVGLMPATLISSGRIVVGGTSSGRLEVIDADGNRVGAHTVGKRIATDLYIVAPNEIVFGTTGLLVRYRIE